MAQNNCAPGDHFTVAQLAEAQAFASYKPFAFNFSPAQQASNAVTLTTLALLLVLLAVALVKKVRRPPSG